MIMTLEKPKRKDGPLIVLKGNLAPDGAVVKVSGLKQRRHEGPAKVFNTEEAAIEATLNGEIVDGDVVGCALCRAERWTRYAGNAVLIEHHFRKRHQSVSDHRWPFFPAVPTGLWSGISHRRHKTADRFALLATNDTVIIDQDTRELTMQVSDEELAKRREKLVLPPLKSRGVLGKYAHIRVIRIERRRHRLLQPQPI